jgi:hypothetical protein
VKLHIEAAVCSIQVVRAQFKMDRCVVGVRVAVEFRLLLCCACAAGVIEFQVELHIVVSYALRFHKSRCYILCS